MLTIVIPEKELWDERNCCFINIKDTKIKMEHSLLSIARWEEKYEKSFLNVGPKTIEEELDYFKFMTITPNIDDSVYLCLTKENKEDIRDYIARKHTATTINTNGNKASNDQFITNELIYYWMVESGIPFECEKWNINRLMTLIEVVSNERGPKQKMSPEQTAAMYAARNKARRAKMNSKG